MEKIFDNIFEKDLGDIVSYLSDFAENGSVFALEGDLGAGKTTFAKALIKTLTGKEKIISPTFNLVQIYEGNGKKVWHYDLYRLEHEHELEELAIEEALNDIVIVEWHEIAKAFLPTETVYIRIDFTCDENARKIIIR